MVRSLHSPRLMLLAGLLAILVVFRLTQPGRYSDHRQPPTASEGNPAELQAELAELEAREADATHSFWALELQAQRHGEVVDALWDALNSSAKKFDVLGSIDFEEIIPFRPGTPEDLPHEIRVFHPATVDTAWTPEDWKSFLLHAETNGWRIAHSEFRHIRFQTNQTHPQSRFYASAHLTNALRPERAVLVGELVIDWKPEPQPASSPAIRRIDATGLTLQRRSGAPPFTQILYEEIAPPKGSYFIDPLIVYDLDRDGTLEIILAASNRLYRRTGTTFTSQPLCSYPPGLIFTSVIADFDGNATPDLLCARFDGLVLFSGSAQGTFDQPGRLAWPAKPRLKYGQVLTCGDVDHDGDLDVWLGQYRVPYERGQMPTPYFDANDGHPSFLLLNTGDGTFLSAPSGAGLSGYRRRAYSGSLADLDNDNDLDLVAVSDFAGIHLFSNNGSGRFKETTSSMLNEHHGFGMAHALADFNADGLLDLLMIGMNSPTADRLDSARLTRPGHLQFDELRPKMAAGNRLFLASTSLNLSDQNELSRSIARSGWSWGCAAADFDNDGFPDVYIGNGHETRQSVRDYEPEFWLHDIYVGSSAEDRAANAYFQAKYRRTRGQGWSYGGYEKNRFYLNRQGRTFVEIGHLMGVALQEDSRNVVAEDLNGDGRLELLVTTFEAWPEVKQTFRIYQNNLAAAGNWIGFDLREEGSGTSPIGARLLVRHARGALVRQVITGDSFRSQHSLRIHFGLGDVSEVEYAEIQWIDGRKLRISHPPINRYHPIRVGTP